MTSANMQFPEWLRVALDHPDWVATQRQAWERYCSPGSLGLPVPQFVQISEENLTELLRLLATHFEQLSRRQLEAARELERIYQAVRYPHRVSEREQPGPGSS